MEQRKKNITLIGAGNLATHLGRALTAAGYRVTQVYSHTLANARLLAEELQAASTDSLSALTNTADVYVFSVKDSVLETVAEQVCSSVSDGQKVFLHTAGSMPMSLFQGKSAHFGVLYPMQTFSKQRAVDFRSIPVFTEANDEMAAETIQAVAASVAERVYELSSEKRKYLHLSAVWACNFVNHCYDMAARQLPQDIPFDVLLPLIDETARKVHELAPREAQTGPAIRYDENVMNRQLQLMEGHPEWQDLYRKLSESIHQRAKE